MSNSTTAPRFALVDVSDICFAVARTEFPKSLVEQVAQSILEVGCVQPIVLKDLGGFQYEVVSGHLAYWGAVRAKEINGRAAELVQAWIAKDPTAALAQLALFS
jgi:hypothetical protein